MEWLHHHPGLINEYLGKDVPLNKLMPAVFFGDGYDLWI